MRGWIVPLIMVCWATLASYTGFLRADDSPGRGDQTERDRRSQLRAADASSPSRSASLARSGQADPQSNSETQDPSTLPPALPGEARTSGMNEPGDGERTPSVAHRSAPLSLADLEAVAVAQQSDDRGRPSTRPAAARLAPSGNTISQSHSGLGSVNALATVPGATQGAFISQDYVTAGKLKVAGQTERAEIEWRCWQLKAQIGRVMNDVRIRYFEVLVAQNAIIAATELERLASEDSKAVRQLVEAKQASRPDVLQAEIHANAVHSSLQDVKLRHQAAWRQLVNLAGVPHLPPAMLAESLEGDLPQFDWEQSLERLLKESPVLRRRTPWFEYRSSRFSFSSGW